MRLRFWAAVVVGCLSAVLAVATLFSREWIEFLFGIDPDNGDGSLEWVLVFATAAIALICFVWARAEWKRAHLAAV